jgi:hexosaminidase
MPDGEFIAGGPPKVVLNPALPMTYEYLSKMISDFLKIFSKTAYFHFGGNIVDFSTCWEKDPLIQLYMKEHQLENGKQLFDHFHSRIRNLSSDVSNNTLIHWVTEANLDAKWNENAILQYSGKLENLPDFIKNYQDHTHILSIDDIFRLDNGFGTSFGSRNGNFSTWAQLISFEPTDYYADKDNLLGGEMTLYSDMISEDNIYNVIWPRIIAFSNIFWSQDQNQVGIMWEGIDWDNIVEDLSGFSDYLAQIEVPSDKISSRYCEEHSERVFKRHNYDNDHKRKPHSQ